MIEGDPQRAVAGALDAAATATGASILDLREDLCPDGTCTTWRDGVGVYRDEDHLSVAESAALAPRFTEAIRAAGSQSQ